MVTFLVRCGHGDIQVLNRFLVETMRVVENRLEINHHHLSSSNKREDVLLELARHRIGTLLGLSFPIWSQYLSAGALPFSTCSR